MVGPRHLARQRHVAPADQPDSGDGVVGGAEGAGCDQRRAVPGAARDAVMRVVSRASARVMAGRMVVSRRASLDVPAPWGPEEHTL